MLFYENSNSSKLVTTAVNECIEENILADFLRKNEAEAIEMCIFEYDDKREKELIRKAEYAEGMKEGERIGREAGKKEEAERIFNIYQLFRANYTENQIKEKLGMNVEEVRKILERFK